MEHNKEVCYENTVIPEKRFGVFKSFWYKKPF